MIPHRTLSSEIFANDLKDRVTKCRKRLRRNRIHRANLDNRVGELFRTPSIRAFEFREHSEDGSTLRKSLVHVRDGETSQRVNEHNEHNEQEVGIT